MREWQAVTGRLCWMAGVVRRIRWCVAVFYAVLAETQRDEEKGLEEIRASKRKDDRPKKGLVAVKRLGVALDWLLEALSNPEDKMTRHENLVRKRPKRMIITDACPRGIGGILVKMHQDGTRSILGAFEAIVSQNNAKLLCLEHGSNMVVIPGMVGDHGNGLHVGSSVLASMWSAAMPVETRMGQTTPISMEALARAWEPQRGWRPQIKGRNSEYNTFGECCGRKHSHRGRSNNSDQRTRKGGQNSKPNFQASPGSGEPRGLDIPQPWRKQIQASENQRGRSFRVEREDLTKSSGGNNAGGGEPGLEPNQTDGRAKRGAIRIATEKARCPVWVAQARKRLRGKFFSANTAASKNSKRNKVWEIAKVVAPSEAVLPLCVDTLEATAATLLESGLQAADQYLGELKAMHIEEGHWWSDKLNHHLTMCKRALSRGKGPEKRAKELRTDKLSEQKFNAKAGELDFPERPGWAYVWATCWMLRAVEAVQVEVKHLTVNEEEKTVKLFIPKSKMDQAEKGTFRTLGCCGKSPCKIFCAWRIAEEAIEGTKKKSKGKTKYLFPTSCGEKVSQFNLIRAWQTYLDEGLTGHSARRSGAMQYTRLGMSVPEISFLGRWKSSAVFRYIEEALQELPANQRIPIASGTTGKAPDPKVPQVSSKGRKRGREEVAAVDFQKLKGFTKLRLQRSAQSCGPFPEEEMGRQPMWWHRLPGTWPWRIGTQPVAGILPEPTRRSS